MFNYLNDPDFLDRMRAVNETMVADLLLQGNALIGQDTNDLHLRWIEFLADAYLTMGNDMRRWGRATLGTLQINQYGMGANLRTFTLANILNLINFWLNLVARWRFPGEP
jgi:hypothetical protein